jgi:hypothetical protein
MENNNNIPSLIDYLYGDLTQKEKEAFEQKLLDNPELKKEYDNLLSARKGLSSLGDQEVMDPFLFQAGFQRSLWNKSINRPRQTILRYGIAIAASLTVFFFIGYFTRATLRFSENSVMLSFGTTREEKPLSRAEVSGLVKGEVAANNQAILEQMKLSQAEVQKVLDDHHKKEAGDIRKLLASYTNAKNGEIDKFLVQLQKDNRDLVNEYIQQASNQQKDYMQNVLSSFADYLQKQRTQDMEKIQSNLITLKESQDRQKLQTSQILTSLISTMNTQNN